MELTQPVPASNSEPVITVNNVTKVFGKEAAVSNLTFNVHEGTIVGLIGPSGCGKTTTVRLLTGIYHPTEGEVRVFNHDPRKFSAAQRNLIGYMPQHFPLYPDLSVSENMNFAASIYGRGIFSRRKRINELLEFVELPDSSRKLARNISGGMQRRLALASTMIHDPALFFLDEPTAGIDPILRRKFWNQFVALKNEGKTLIITTQYVNEAAYCDYVGVMAEGKLLLLETPEQLRHRAFGGDVINLSTEQHVDYALLREIEALPFNRSKAQLLSDGTVRLTVDDASTAMPELMHLLTQREIRINKLDEYLPPYDDIFVKVVEDYQTSQQAVQQTEAK